MDACTGPAQVQPRQKSQPRKGEVGTKSYLPTKKLFVVVIPARTEKISFQPHSKAGPTPRELLINTKQTPCFLCVFCLFGWLVGWLNLVFCLGFDKNNIKKRSIWEELGKRNNMTNILYK